jgi:prevent-host-death family protein
MLVTAKDLRFNISMLFNVLSKGEDVTITYRGKPKAKLISINSAKEQKDTSIFGMWSDKDIEVDSFVRDLRAGRNFDL